MDIYLIRAGIVENIVSVASLEQAAQMYPEHTLVERTPDNSHHADGSPVNPGDSLP